LDRFRKSQNEEKEYTMNWLGKAGKTSLLALAIGALFLLPRANAQTGTSTTTPEAKETNTDDGWHVGITPYIWFSGVHGTVGALGHDAAVNASFGDIFNYLNIGAMGTLEVRHNRVLMPLDFFWIKLSDNKTLPLNDAEAESIQAKMTESIVTPKIGYRIGNGKRVKVDALFGARIWHLHTDLTLQPVQIANGFSQSATWGDAVAGGRIEVGLSPKASVIILGDAGGGAARSDFQAAGLLGYKISRRCVLLAGYRYLSVNYQPNGKLQFVYNVNMPGLVLGATFNLK
jgi:hypothetical protein